MYRLILILIPLNLFGQSPLTSGFFNYELTDRYEILSDTINNHIFSAVKPFSRKAVVQFANTIKPLSKVDEFNKSYLLTDNFIYSQLKKTHKPTLNKKKIFSVENSLLLVNRSDIKLTLNPILGLDIAFDKNDTLNIYRNSRGIELRGLIGEKVGFYSRIIENQVRFPNYTRRKNINSGVVNGSTLFKTINPYSRDFFNASGYVVFAPVDEINIQFGQDNNSIGNGYRSLILSDFSAPYLFLKFNTKVWKFNYQNLFSKHVDYSRIINQPTVGDIKEDLSGIPHKNKYSAFHHLSINVLKNLNIGFFENIIFDRSDSTQSNSYDVSYLNPLIFYTAVNHGLNSTDNAVVGIDWKWNFKNHFSFYGQFVLDEFKKDELFSRSQSWVNKWAYQGGLKYINVLNVSNLDMQLEVNQLRPYLYQHSDISQNWIHFNQSLSHPLGSNLREFIAILRYQPFARLNFKAAFSHSIQGIDTSLLSTNFGGNYLRSYEINELGPLNQAVPMFSGIKNMVTAFSIDAHYMIYHNLFLDAGLFIRKENNPTISERLNMIFRFGLRMNLNQIDYRI